MSAAEARAAVVAAYRDRKLRHQVVTEALGARSRLVSNLRGVAFAAAVIAALTGVFGGDGARSVAWLVAGLSGAVFVAFVAWHARVIDAEDAARRRLLVSENAILRVTGGWRDFANDGAELSRGPHPYADDLDLFGKGSLYQRLSVAHTRFGEATLARYLTNTPDLELSRLRQQAVRALASEQDFREELEALALAVAAPHGTRGTTAARPAPDPEPLLGWAESEPTLSRLPLVVWAARLLPVWSIAGLTAWGVGSVTPVVWVVPLLLATAINLRTRETAARVFAAVSTTEGAFLRYGAMLSLIESLKVDAELVRDVQQRLMSGALRPSLAMREFRRAVGWFDLRHNGLVHPFANAVLLWDVHCVLGLERWQQRAGRAARGWFEALGEFEALISLAGFAHDEPGFAFPELCDPGARFEAVGLGHPLLDAERRAPNDVRLEGAGRALLITGSNMSGKSTLLRSMGLGVVLAGAGGPVCAQSLAVSRFTLRTSLRVRDSLSGGVSHFYAELEKLKAALDATSGAAPVLFLLDEVLHGTNSRERQIGARWVLAELLRRGATGVVTTHDMGLCQLPEPLMSQVTQKHFRETVENERMSFDYQLREGPVQSGNALRLMRLVGLDVPLTE